MADKSSKIYMKIKIYPVRLKLGSVWWIERKVIDDGHGNKKYVAKSGSLSSLVLKLHKILRGSFLCVKKMKVTKKLNKSEEEIQTDCYTKYRDKKTGVVPRLLKEKCDDSIGLYIHFDNRINPLLSFSELKASITTKKTLMKSKAIVAMVYQGEDVEKEEFMVCGH